MKYLKVLNIAPRGYNIGNELIIECLCQAFGSFSSTQLSITTIAATDKWFGSSAPTGLTARSVHFANQFFDAVILGGGNLFENGEIDLNANAIKALQVPLVIYSVSRGRIYSRDDQLVERTDVIDDSLLSLLVNKSICVAVRDKATYDYINYSLPSADNTSLSIGLCPTLLTSSLIASSQKPTSLTRDEDPSNLATISVRHPNLMNISSSRQFRIREDLEKTIARLRAIGFHPLAIAHDFRDISYAASLSCDYVFANHLTHYLRILKSSSLHLSYRLHSFLPCLSMGVPSIKLSYDERAISMLECIGLDSWNIDIVKSNSVSDDIIDRINNMDVLRKWTVNTLPSIQAEIKDTICNISNSLSCGVS